MQKDNLFILPEWYSGSFSPSLRISPIIRGCRLRRHWTFIRPPVCGSEDWGGQLILECLLAL